MRIYAQITTKDKAWLTRFLKYLMHIEDDLNYKECIFSGDWPSAVEQLKFALERAVEIRKAREKAERESMALLESKFAQKELASIHKVSLPENKPAQEKPASNP